MSYQMLCWRRVIYCAWWRLYPQVCIHPTGQQNHSAGSCWLPAAGGLSGPPGIGRLRFFLRQSRRRGEWVPRDQRHGRHSREGQRNGGWCCRLGVEQGFRVFWLTLLVQPIERETKLFHVTITSILIFNIYFWLRFGLANAINDY